MNFHSKVHLLIFSRIHPDHRQALQLVFQPAMHQLPLAPRQMGPSLVPLAEQHCIQSNQPLVLFPNKELFQSQTNSMLPGL